MAKHPIRSRRMEVRRATTFRPAAVALGALLILLTVPLPLPNLLPSAAARGPSDSPRLTGASAMLESHTGSLLVDYYETFLRDHDVDAFRNHVAARYLEGTLARLVDSPNVQARRAAVFALGLCGTIDANAAVAKALKDVDPTVRRLGENALWAIWFRADSPANNATLEKVAALIAQQRLEEAVKLATELIERAPGFAEAYNQRAIAEFFLGRFKESADDCKRVLARNPFHTGALAGMGRCLLQLEQRDEAIKTFRRASRLQPHNAELRQMISALESGYP